jgi:hypothetical protein
MKTKRRRRVSAIKYTGRNHQQVLAWLAPDWTKAQRQQMINGFKPLWLEMDEGRMMEIEPGAWVIRVGKDGFNSVSAEDFAARFIATP